MKKLICTVYVKDSKIELYEDLENELLFILGFNHKNNEYFASNCDSLNEFIRFFLSLSNDFILNDVRYKEVLKKEVKKYLGKLIINNGKEKYINNLTYVLEVLKNEL